MARQMSRRLVALSTAAIATVFTVGYVHSQPAAAQLTSTHSIATSAAGATPGASIRLQTRASSTRAVASTPTVAINPSFTLLPLAARRSGDDRRGGDREGGGNAAPRLFLPVTTSTPLPSAISNATTTSVPVVNSNTTATGTAQGARYRDGSYTGMGMNRHGDVHVTVVIAGGRIASAAISACGMQYPCSRIAMLPGEVLALQSANTDLVSGATMSSTAYQGAVAQALAKAAM